MNFLKREKTDRKYVLKEAPIKSGVVSIGVSLLGLGVGVTLIVWGLFLAVIRALVYVFTLGGRL